MKTARLTRYAITTPSTAVGSMWKSRPMVGRATLTIVMSMMFMNMADTNTAPTAIFWFMRNAGTRLILDDRYSLESPAGRPGRPAPELRN